MNSQTKLFQISRFNFKLNHLVIIGVLVLAFSTSFLIRSQPGNYGFELNEFDPFFNFRATEYVVENGLFEYLSWWDDKSWYPQGRDVSGTSQIMLHLTAATTYQIFASNYNLYDFTVIFPVIIGSLTVIVIFGLVRLFGGTTAGLIASLLFAISLPIILRGSLGWFKSEPLGLFYGLLALYLFLSGIKSKNKKIIIPKIIFGGIIMGFGISSWGGNQFFIIPIGLFILTLPFLRKDHKFLLWSIPLFVLSLIVTASLFEERPTSIAFGLPGLALIIPTLFMAFVIFIQKISSEKNKIRNAFLGLLLLFIVLFGFTIINSDLELTRSTPETPIIWDSIIPENLPISDNIAIEQNNDTWKRTINSDGDGTFSVDLGGTVELILKNEPNNAILLPSNITGSKQLIGFGYSFPDESNPIDFAIYYEDNDSFQAYENGIFTKINLNYNLDDEFKIILDGNNDDVKLYKNDIVVHKFSTAPVDGYSVYATSFEINTINASYIDNSKYKLELVPIPTHRYANALNPFLTTSDPLTDSVSEHATTTLQESYYFHSIFLIFAGIGIWLILNKKILQDEILMKKDLTAFVLIIGMTGVYVSSAFVRLEIFASISLIILASIGLSLLSKEIFKIKYSGIKNYFLKISFVTIILILFIIPLTYPADANWISMSSYPATILNGGSHHPVSPDWLETLEWIKMNTPEDAIIASWWDYGYWITTMSERTTLIDNATLATNQIQRLAEIFLSTPDEAWNLLNEWDTDYVVIFIATQKLDAKADDGRSFYVLNGGGDESKKPWIMKIAEVEPIEKYLHSDDATGTDYFWNETLLGQMIPFNTELYYNDYTEQVSENYIYGYIPISLKNIKYGSNSDTPLNLVYASSSFITEQTETETAVLVYKINKNYTPSKIDLQ